MQRVAKLVVFLNPLPLRNAAGVVVGDREKFSAVDAELGASVRHCRPRFWPVIPKAITSALGNRAARSPEKERLKCPEILISGVVFGADLKFR